MELARVADGDGNGLYEFDPRRLTWTDLSSSTAGPTPPGLRAMGMAAAAGKVYIFGGARLQPPGPSSTYNSEEGTFGGDL